ncbi:MAG: penicillin-binding transpeptidase domain-containing protein [bacterium]|nr:penicillin-binding transpeptidase domain-containing protein [bacterium]
MQQQSKQQEWTKVHHRKKIVLIFVCVFFVMLFLMGRLVYLMVFGSSYYGDKAKDIHERERDIKAARGKLYDRNGVLLASNRTVCTISVIHSQIEEPERVIKELSKLLSIDEEQVRKRVEKYSSIERIRSNVDKETGDKIRELNLAGVKVDEDYKRYYPYGELASKVLGFTGGDNQGIVGLEVKYDDVLSGEPGKILTLTDAKGIELEGVGERRKEPINGKDLYLSLDYNIQMYATQAAKKVREQKSADSVEILAMNPSNGEIYAMVNVPEFDLNEPFVLTQDYESDTLKKQDALNAMWRNKCLNDTYEPGSTFKIITSAAALEEGVVSVDDHFFCPGYIVIEDRKIRCHKIAGHGSESFVQGLQNSCNPVFIDVGQRLGVDNYVKYFKQFGLMKLTGIDLPGEAGTIMHAKENMGPVELATVSFGQSFQITPIQLATTVSSIINGGIRVTPHLALRAVDADGTVVEDYSKKYEKNEKNRILSAETSRLLAGLLETVVSEGSGKNAYIEGYSIGGKTATSQTLPRSSNKYISSFIGFSPADNPQFLVLVIIHNPKGIYYGGTIAAPVARDIFKNFLPYLNLH